MNYSIAKIQEEYPHLDRDILLKLLEIGREACKNLTDVNIDEIISKLRGLVSEN